MEHWTPSFMDGRDTWLLADLYVNKALIGEDELLRHGACRQGTKRPVADGLREQNTVMQYVEHGTFALLYRRLTCPECGQNHILVHACGEIGMGCTVTFVNGIWGVDVLPSR
ncbi:MAG: hypothetical protein RL318_1900 [Fibrobacterota bacterium]